MYEAPAFLEALGYVAWGEGPKTYDFLKFLFLRNGLNFSVKILRIYWAL